MTSVDAALERLMAALERLDAAVDSRGARIAELRQGLTDAAAENRALTERVDRLSVRRPARPAARGRVRLGDAAD